MSNSSTHLAALRLERLMRTGAYPIHSTDDALRFLSDVGFCRFSHHGEVELPCFTDSFAPEVSDQYWAWKDSLPNTRQVYYGTVFRFHLSDSPRPGFLSLPMLAARYALAPISQFGGERDMLTRWTSVSREALSLVQAVEESGPLSTKSLRRATGLDGKHHENLFHKCLIEAQTHFLLVRTGVTSTSRGNYAYVWESFERAYPAILEQVREMTDQAAAEALVHQYIDTAICSSPARMAFVLSLDEKLLQAAAENLVKQSRLVRQGDDYFIPPPGAAVDDQLRPG